MEYSKIWGPDHLGNVCFINAQSIYQRTHAPLSQRLKPVFLRKLVGIYNSKRFPYDVLVVVNIFGWVEVLRETHPAMSCHFFCLLVLFFVLFFLYILCCILSALCCILSGGFWLCHNKIYQILPLISVIYL